MTLSISEKKRLKQKYGDWAVITGASSGIGLEIAYCLADAGFNLVINARHLNTLTVAGENIKSRYGVQVEIIAADASLPDGIETIVKATQLLDVGLLIVSAGYGTSGSFISSPLRSETDMLRLNCEGLLAITHHYSQRFVDQQKGGIVLMSSIVAFQGVPFSANYAATKAYVQSLGEALAVELKPYGVDVLTAAPGPVSSGFGERANMRMSISLKPSDVAAPILKALGRQSTVLPGLLTKVLVYALRTVPRWGKVKIMQKVMEGMTKHQK